MAIYLIIDGYNLLGVDSKLGVWKKVEEARERLLQRLLEYKKVKGHRMTVVFDGKGSGNPQRERINRGGIEVIFSSSGEEADQILKEIAKTVREKATIVTSDRDIASWAMAHGSVVISSGEFASLMDKARYAEINPVRKPGGGLLSNGVKGLDPDEEEGLPSPTMKKGNPRRPSREERKRLQRMKKL